MCYLIFILKKQKLNSELKYFFIGLLDYCDFYPAICKVLKTFLSVFPLTWIIEKKFSNKNENLALVDYV